jgi:hypothetical protein
MKKERQIGIRVGVPAFFALELEDVYRHTGGAHRALAFPDFVGLLVGLGLEVYRKGKALPEAGQEEAPEDIEEGEQTEADTLHLFDMDRNGLHDLFRDFDRAMEPQEEGPHLHLLHTEEPA